MQRAGYWPLRRGPVQTLQINVGKVCNQACHHCHVEAGPSRTETMERPTAVRIVELLERSPEVERVDITGGAPELNPNFRFLVESSRRLHRHVIDRCNLTVLYEPGQEDTAEFLARNQVEIVASLPCYQPENVDRQRGRGVFDRSIRALRLLNELGYGQEDSPLRLNLVFNPGGPSLPPAQEALEASYKEELWSRFGIRFHRLLTLANMPIRRFAEELARAGQSSAYQSLLVQSLQSGDHSRVDVYFTSVRRIRRWIIRLRLQSDVGYRPDGRFRDPVGSGRFTGSGRTTHRHRLPLLWLHGRQWFELRWRPYLKELTASSSLSKISKTWAIWVMLRTSRMLEGSRSSFI